VGTKVAIVGRDGRLGQCESSALQAAARNRQQFAPGIGIHRKHRIQRAERFGERAFAGIPVNSIECQASIDIRNHTVQNSLDSDGTDVGNDFERQRWNPIEKFAQIEIFEDCIGQSAIGWTTRRALDLEHMWICLLITLASVEPECSGRFEVACRTSQQITIGPNAPN
jgi:hypothetical protein